MAKIMHPSMNKASGQASSVQQVNNQPQNYVVDNISAYENQTQSANPTVESMMQKFQEGGPVSFGVSASEPIAEVKPIIDEESRKKLEQILFLGKLTRNINIAGAEIVISTLSNREHTDMVKELYRFGESADLLTIRVLALANAVKSINGTLLENVPIEGEFDSIYHKKMAVIDNMQMFVIENIYKEYTALLGELSTLTQNDTIKK